MKIILLLKSVPIFSICVKKLEFDLIMNNSHSQELEPLSPAPAKKSGSDRSTTLLTTVQTKLIYGMFYTVTISNLKDFRKL